MTTNLFDLKEGLWQLVTMDEVETDDDIENWHAEAIALLEGEFSDKIDSLAALVKHLESDAGFIAEEAKRMAARAKSVKNRAQRLKEYMRDAILARPFVDKKGEMKPETVKTGRFTVYASQSGPSIDKDVVDVMEAEEPFISFEPKIQAKVAMDHIKSTGEIPKGFEDAIKEGKWSLTIR